MTVSLSHLLIPAIQNHNRPSVYRTTLTLILHFQGANTYQGRPSHLHLLLPPSLFCFVIFEVLWAQLLPVWIISRVNTTTTLQPELTESRKGKQTPPKNGSDTAHATLVLLLPPEIEGMILMWIFWHRTSIYVNGMPNISCGCTVQHVEKGNQNQDEGRRKLDFLVAQGEKRIPGKNSCIEWDWGVDSIFSPLLLN